MKPQHFTELVETISLTYKISKRKIAARIDIPPTTLHWYQRYGLPESRKSKIVDRLRALYLELLHDK